VAPASPSVSSYVPVIHGCDLMCTFCIIPFRRGRQVSRPIEDITHQVDLMTQRGMKEVTLLGQTVDAYGHDFDEPCDLSRLLHAVHSVEGLERLRFLTSHPIFMSQDIIDAVAELPKVCEHINLPFQAGDDDVLEAMRRRYTQGQYRELVDRIRRTVPYVAISTDVIVGFPGETHEQFMETYRLVEDIEFDKVHMAAYSPRPGTFAIRRLPDSVTREEKQRRLKSLESLQKEIQEKKNRRLVGTTEEVLVEGRKKGRWQGRTRQDKLVFFEHPSDMLGRTVEVKIEAATAWSLRGAPTKERQPSHARVSP
jgi:tRNA-2-methylthio-N6-dimethylallyladenosine synthase